MPSDFVAVPAELADDGLEIGEGESFAELAPRLIERALAAKGPGGVRLAVSGSHAAH
jgi:hypothetical protein